MSPPLNSFGIARPPEETRVVVAMSGGVDSSVVAAWAKSQGYDVVGITLQLYDHGLAVQRKGACCAGQDIYDARLVADRFGFPHYLLDYESRFSAAVMEDFADGYLRGETPIPCVRCNQTVKFRDLLDTARDLGGDCLATGHYVRRVDGASGPELHRAADPDKDQSYFLFATTAAQLGFLRFPLGGMTKPETRALARELGVPVADKADSQDICFVPGGRYTDVVTRLRPGAAEPGEIVHLDGRVLGRHDGIIHFTIGQRRGLALGDHTAGGGAPLYVVGLDAAQRRVIVGPREALGRDIVSVGAINWLDARPVGPEGRRLTVKLRSVQPAVPATLFVRAAAPDTGDLVLDTPQDGVAPGQAAVFYDGDRLLGGGWIRAAARRLEHAA